MRLFVALTLPARAVADLEAVLAGIRHGAPGLRWVAPERWHLTLSFFGEVAEERVANLRQRLDAQLCGARSPRLRLSGAGRFGSQVLWVGLAGDVGPLAGLAGRVAVRDGPVPASPSAEGPVPASPSAEGDRTYRPHLTLARARPRDAADLRAAAAALAGYSGPDWAAESVRLVRSHLGSRTRYETVAAWPLDSTRADP